MAGGPSGIGRAPGGLYRFVHDRVQEAAYSLIPEAERAAAHLRIGRLLAGAEAAGGVERGIFDIVSQLNRGAALITEPEEREQLAELNLIAGRRAKASTAYASALHLFHRRRGAAAGRRVGAPARTHLSRWSCNRAECEFLTGALAKRSALADCLIAPQLRSSTPPSPACRSTSTRRSVRATARSPPASTICAVTLGSNGRRIRQTRRCAGNMQQIWSQLARPPDRGPDRAAPDDRSGVPARRWTF